MCLEMSLMPNIFLSSVPYMPCDCSLKHRASTCVHSKFHFWTVLLRHLAVKHKSKTTWVYFQSWTAQTEFLNVITASDGQRWYPCPRETWRHTQGWYCRNYWNSTPWLLAWLAETIWKNHLMLNLIVSYCFCGIFPGKEHVRTLHHHKASVWNFWKQLWEALAHKNCSSDTEWGSQSVFALQVSVYPYGGVFAVAVMGSFRKVKLKNKGTEQLDLSGSSVLVRFQNQIVWKE